MNERCKRSNGESIVTASKNIRFCPSLKGFGLSNLLSEFNNIIQLTLTRQQSSPSLLITIFNPITIKEQMSQVISWVNTNVNFLKKVP